MDILNQIKNYLLVTWQRLKGETPRYWRRLSMFGASLTAISLFLTENDSIIPEQYKYITKYVSVAAAVVALMSRLATTDTALAEKSEEVLLKENADKPLKEI